MTDRDGIERIYDAVLRLEATNREDHECIQTQIRGYASRTIKLETAVEELAKDVAENRTAIRVTGERVSKIGSAVDHIKGHWKVILPVSIALLLGAGGVIIEALVGS